VSPLIGDLLPAGVRHAEEFCDPPATAPSVVLFPEEAALVARAVETRRREFATGRACARRALAGLGEQPAALLPGRRGVPGWPEGTIGSITHCEGYRAAAVARRGPLVALGIDAEPNLPLAPGMLAAVALPGEARAVSALLAEHPRVRWDRLLFSAKEAVYKAWFPLTMRELGFDAAVVQFDPGGGFLARFTAGSPAHGTVSGRWLARDGLLLCAVAVRAGAAAGRSDGLVFAGPPTGRPTRPGRRASLSGARP
jgi:4'-phosphopantetheinyl transferase EntD